MSGVIGRYEAALLEVAQEWDRQIVTLTELRDVFLERVAQEQKALRATEENLELAIQSRDSLRVHLAPEVRELYRREFTPPVAEEDLQLGADQ